MKKQVKQQLDWLTKELTKLFTGAEVRSVMAYGTNVNVSVEGVIGWENNGGLLGTLLKLRDLGKADDVDMPSHYHVDGCPTCDFGGYDVWEFELKNCKL